MNFESLPNEIFLEIFDYLDGSDLFYTFDALNSRLNKLLYQENRRFRFDFRSISKVRFDQVCQQYLPRIADRVIALSFARLNDIPEQFPLFCSYIPSFASFTNLQSLALPCTERCKTTTRLVDRLGVISPSAAVHWYSKNFGQKHNQLQSILDTIWSLPKLAHCKMGVLAFAQILPTNISMSLKCLSWDEEGISCNELVQLVQHTPNMTHLSISLVDSKIDDIPIVFSTLISFQLRVYCAKEWRIILLLQKMPNLHSLEINLVCRNFYGPQLEDLITSYLPKLAKFRLKMMMGCFFVRRVLDKVISCVDSFRSSFWTERHQWFVRCFRLDQMVYICTVPNTFAGDNFSIPYLFYSTDPQDGLQSVTSDTSNRSSSVFLKDFPYRCVPFNNIEAALIALPDSSRHWSMITNFPRLHSLEIYAYNRISPTQLQAIFDRAPNLRHLRLRASESSTFEALLSLKNLPTSFRHFDLNDKRPLFTPNELIEFACSLFARQCEMLSIHVWNEEDILTLITCMSQLRVLEVTCYDIQCANHVKAETPEEQESVRDELIQWLQEHLPSTCLISKSPQSHTNVQIWL